MGGSFSGINTALTSLYAQRRGLDVTGQNIANASTEGYTRQRVVMKSVNDNTHAGIYATSDGVGNGVAIKSVERMANSALDQRSYTEHGNSAYQNTKATAYGLMEDVFGEPSDTALQARMQDMWDGWNEVASNFDKPATKSAMLEQSATVAASLNDAAASLNNQYKSTRAGLDTSVSEVNKTAESIAKLNHEIVLATQSGLQANELQDERGRQILKLSELAGATVTDQPNGAVNVFLGNAPLVSEFKAREIWVTPGSAQRMEDLATTEVNLQWKDVGTPVSSGGSMGAQMEMVARGGTIQGMSNRLDKVATTLAENVNTVHSAGYSTTGVTGLDFFVSNDDNPLSAANIGVNRDLMSDVNKVAVSSGDPNGVGTTTRILNGNVADQLADLADSKTGADSEYQSMIGDLGVASQSSIRRRDIQNAVTDQVDAARSAESGVNLDEEMTNLLTYQRGYEAASRVLTTIDSMLDQLINRTGLVGR
ncbi:flagellar hook-associated protein FlgK [Actinoplanes couchii]|uniref:Flagellar hook-associated protein 1 n=1 Tax=Actinoplanes couchii TaxID=403638 RepID=A0ABQ3XA82_9ACTN|nr:flagellar hook-associated protein FlgK [Actinoplanes couchii]MDR6324979.1 flagellar hook-associated protein 1 FlgK [Actinoplanes couchii]GID55400.1 flagellar hook-associated protein 1 [Actinoplanes couchii]